MPTKSEIKLITGLKDKKRREDAGLFLAEGEKVVRELLLAGYDQPFTLYALPAFLERLDPSLRSLHQWEEVSATDMQRMSHLQSPPEVMAVVAYKPHAFQPFPVQSWSLMLDGLQDPGNLGTIIRIADWFGIGHIYATADTADCYNPKVVQASMGSLFRVRIMYGPCEQWLLQSPVPIYGTDMEGTSIWQAQHPQPGVIVIGHEGKGIRPAMAASLQQVWSIPRLGKAESLNAGVAAGIILSHLLKA